MSRNSVYQLIICALASIAMITGCGDGGSELNPSDEPEYYIDLAGRVTYDHVPTTENSGLDYANTTVRPIRNALVEALDIEDKSLASTTTDNSGNYILNVPANWNMKVRIKAQSIVTGPPSWNISVVDNTNRKALYVMDSAMFTSDDSHMSGKNLRADSGWGSTSYTSVRVAAPFAIFDTIMRSAELLADADPLIVLPTLRVNWSDSNTSYSGDTASGMIGTSSYYPSEGEIYILGSQNSDTDEYDEHIISHEFMHYFMDKLGRDDSMGGSHGGGDKLDARIAFSEGLGNAFSAMALDDSVYKDTMGLWQADTAIMMDIEDNYLDPYSVGWYSESSVQSLLYDLFDQANDGADTIEMGFDEIYNVLTTGLQSSDSFATITSFSYFLKQEAPSQAAAIDTMLRDADITTTPADQFDSSGTETNDGGNQDALPMYTQLTRSLGSTTICVNGNDGNYNKLANRRYFYFTLTSDTSVNIEAVPQSTNGMAVIVLYNSGTLLQSSGEGGIASGQTTNINASLAAGTYLGELLDWNIVGEMYFGQLCFDLRLY